MTYPSDYKPGQVLLAADLNASFDGKTENSNAAITGGAAEGLDHVYIVGANDATNTQTGALVVTGGVGIGLQLQVGGKLTVGANAQINSAAVSNDAATGALIVAGGVGVGGAINSGGHIKAIGNLLGAMVISTDQTNAVDPVTGALTTAGGAGIAKDLHVGGATAVGGALTVQGNATVAGSASVGSLVIAPGGGITFGDGSTQVGAPIPEAPSDGNKYGRKDVAWVVLTDIPEAPLDAHKYGRDNAAWVVLTDIPEAPSDGNTYGRNNAAWVLVEGGGGGGIPDAPADGLAYARADHAWAEVVPKSGGEFTGPINGPSINTTGTISINAPHAVLTLNNSGAETDYAAVMSYTNNMLRWQSMLGDNSPETGGNTGTDVRFNRFSDTGDFLGSPLVLNRATGAALHEDGTIAAPALAFASEPGLGFYRGGSGGEIAIAAGGFRVFDFYTAATYSTLSVNPKAIGSSNIWMTNAPNGAANYNAINIVNDQTGYSISESLSGTATTKKLSLNFPAGVKLGNFAQIGGASAGSLVLDRPTGQESTIKFLGDGVQRWYIAHGASDLLAFCACDASGAFKTSPLQINYADSSTNVTASLLVGVQAYKPGGGSWADSSDARIKENVVDYASGLNAILALRPVTFNFKAETGRDVSKSYIGLIAQEAEIAMPEMVSTSEVTIGGVTLPDMRTLDSSALVYALVNAVKNLNTTITTSQTHIANLEHRLQAVSDALDNL